jgi:hypothetical protein
MPQMTDAEVAADKLAQVSLELETISGYAAKTAGELAEAIELLKPFAFWYEGTSEDSPQRRAAAFVKAHQPQHSKE